MSGQAMVRAMANVLVVATVVLSVAMVAAGVWWLCDVRVPTSSVWWLAGATGVCLVGAVVLDAEAGRF